MGIVMGLVAGLVEEIGWTGFALPRMQTQHGILGASIILGFVHALWHLAADYLGNSNAFGDHWLPYFAGFFIFVIALRVLIAWVYANTESLLLAQFMHASSTGFLAVLVPIGIGGLYWSNFYTAYAVVLWGAVVIVLARYGEGLVRGPERDAAR
jgi:membrane protease YdiL (CAAX protease family)